MAISDTKGRVKGRVDNPSADPPLRDDGKLAVGVAVGEGGHKILQIPFFFMYASYSCTLLLNTQWAGEASHIIGCLCRHL